MIGVLIRIGQFIALIFPFFRDLFSKTLMLAFGLGFAKIIGFLGVGLITYNSAMFGVDYFVQLIQSNMELFPDQFKSIVYAVFTDLRVNSAFSIVLSAYAIRLTMFTFTRFQFGQSSN